MTRSIDERQTPEEDYFIPILQVLVDAGGRAHRSEVVDRVGPKMTFVDADLEYRPDGTQKWVRRVGYAIGKMRKAKLGLIEPAAGGNVVIISDKGRKYLSDSME
jgi:Mrr restriction endonuclease-like protein